MEKHEIITLGYLHDGYKRNTMVLGVGGVSVSLAARDYKDPIKFLVRKKHDKRNE